MLAENTLVILKPDTLYRGLVGVAFQRLEQVGLKMVACKMMYPDMAILDKMYNIDNTEWVDMLGVKTLETFEKFSIDPIKQTGTADPHELGVSIIKHLKEYMQMGPLIATVWEGIEAVFAARKVRGSTTPITADIGSMIGDFSHLSQMSTTAKGKAIQNLMHTSATSEEAKDEIEIWFGKDFTPMNYERTDEIFF